MSVQSLPTIDQALCIGCGKCEMECPTQAVEMMDGFPVIVRAADCSYCGICEEICPQHAIQLFYRISIKKK